MTKGSLHFFFISAILLITLSTMAQNPSGQITDWKDDARGAYTIIHDDYGDPGVDGIWRYADTICANRGVTFTFGAISSACEASRSINGYPTPYDYAKEVMMAQHGHEIINHSHTHTCAVGNAGWFPCDLAPGESWGESASNPEFAEQLETSHESITDHTGHAPVYYIFPYDRFTELANNRLKTLGYIGSRTGWNSPLAGSGWYHRNGYENSDEANFYPDADGFFRTAVEVFDDVDRNKDVADQVAELNGEVDNCMNTNMWANRELHNVGTSGWGSVKVESYRQHIDYVKEKKESGELWVATVSEILTYQMQKLKFAPLVSYTAQNNQVSVNWQTINSQYAVVASEYLAPLDIKCPITLHLDLDGLDGEWTVVQNGIVITDVNQVADQLYINVYPHKGNLVITKSGNLGNQPPYVANDIPNYSNLVSNFDPIEIDLFDVFEDFETSDANLILTVSGNSALGVVFNGGLATITSPQDWSGSETITFTAEDEEGETVATSVNITATDVFTGHTPFGGSPISIPGRIEAENFDEGEQGVVYNDIVTNYEPDRWSNPYRVGHPVDIADISGVGYVVNYTETGEWLDYSINVEEAGYYFVDFSIAQQENQWGTPVGQIKLYIDGEEWVPTTTMQYTTSWTSYETVRYPSSLFLSQGGHVLRLEFVRGSVDIDYVDITTDLITSSRDEEKENEVFFLYPNPSSDFVNIEGIFESVQIYNQFGIEIMSSTESVIDVSSLAPGVYYFKRDNGTSVVKFVKN